MLAIVYGLSSDLAVSCSGPSYSTQKSGTPYHGRSQSARKHSSGPLSRPITCHFSIVHVNVAIEEVAITNPV